MLSVHQDVPLRFIADMGGDLDTNSAKVIEETPLLLRPRVALQIGLHQRLGFVI